MCVILACKESRPDDEVLEQAEDENKDGIGIAWVQGKAGHEKVRWEKGLDLKGLWPILKRATFPYMIHFRATSIGPSVRELCHPFPIVPGTDTTPPDAPLSLTGTAGMVLMHNGTWNTWDDKLLAHFLASGRKVPGSLWSDSRALAYLVAAHGTGILKFIHYAGRISLLSADENGAEMRCYGDGWIEKKGWLQSQTIGDRRGKGHGTQTSNRTSPPLLGPARSPTTCGATPVSQFTEAPGTVTLAEIDEMIREIRLQKEGLHAA